MARVMVNEGVAAKKAYRNVRNKTVDVMWIISRQRRGRGETTGISVSKIGERGGKWRAK